jgi:hypothetical protein
MSDEARRALLAEVWASFRLLERLLDRGPDEAARVTVESGSCEMLEDVASLSAAGGSDAELVEATARMRRANEAVRRMMTDA